jgi:hypothetical protein
LGGVDIWAEEVALQTGRSAIIHAPQCLTWEKGYKPRNIKIAQDADVVHVLVVARPPGGTLSYCYHCGTNDHVRSGGCWTGKYARTELGKEWVTHVLR